MAPLLRSRQRCVHSYWPVYQHPTRCRGALRSVCPRFPVLKLWHEAPLAGPDGYSFLLLSLPLRVVPPLAWPLLPWGSAQPSRPTPGTARKPAAASHPLTGHVGAGNSPALNMLLVHGLPGSAGAPGGSGKDRVVARPALGVLTFSTRSGW